MVDTLDRYRREGRFLLHAFVVMPDHVHALITPASDVSLEKAIQFIKGGFSFQLKNRGEVWERGHFDKRVPDSIAFNACVTYIHNNPVAARLVKVDHAYPYSSAIHLNQMDAMPDWFA